METIRDQFAVTSPGRSLARASGAVQMAIDSHLLARAVDNGGVVFRLYQMSPPAVSIGRHQKWRNVVDADLCLANGWDWVRRPTGGGALLHKCELNYSVVTPRGILAPSGPGEFRAVFDAIGRALSSALEDMGLHPELHVGDRSNHQPQHGLCGRSITGNEIALRDRKIVAAAQMITPTGILQHGTIYISAPDAADRFWPQAAHASVPPDYAQRWTDLGSEFHDRPWEDISRCLEQGFRKHLTATCQSLEFLTRDWDVVEAIVRDWAASGWQNSR